MLSWIIEWYSRDKTDEVVIPGRICPRHYLPHLHWVENEQCHYHEKWWHMAHHIVYCNMMNCKHAGKMMRAYRNRR
jgi:hypothetical protein